MRTRATQLVSAAAVLAALGVTGCSPAAPAAPGPTSHEATATGGPAGTTTPAVPSPTPTPTPTPLPPAAALPTPPPEMSRDDEAGAVAAAEYFLDLYTYTESTQDTAPWLAMSHPDCIFCNSVQDHVSATRAAGRVVFPAPIAVHSRQTTMLSPAVCNIALDVSTGPDQVWAAEGQLLDAGIQTRGRMTLVLYFHAQGWKIRGVQLEQQS